MYAMPIRPTSPVYIKSVLDYFFNRNYVFIVLAVFPVHRSVVSGYGCGACLSTGNALLVLLQIILCSRDNIVISHWLPVQSRRLHYV